MSENYTPEQTNRVIDNEARRLRARMTLARGGAVTMVVLAFAVVALVVHPDVKLSVNISVVATITFAVTISLSVAANVAQILRNRSYKKRAELAEERCQGLEARLKAIEDGDTR